MNLFNCAHIHVPSMHTSTTRRYYLLVPLFFLFRSKELPNESYSLSIITAILSGTEWRHLNFSRLPVISLHGIRHRLHLSLLWPRNCFVGETWSPWSVIPPRGCSCFFYWYSAAAAAIAIAIAIVVVAATTATATATVTVTVTAVSIVRSIAAHSLHRVALHNFDCLHYFVITASVTYQCRG